MKGRKFFNGRKLCGCTLAHMSFKAPNLVSTSLSRDGVSIPAAFHTLKNSGVNPNSLRSL